MMDQLFNAKDQWNKERKLYLAIIGGLIFFLLIMIYQSKTKLTDITVHIPPDLSNGASFNAAYVFKPNVFSFTETVWSTINNWNTDGSKDYANNLTAYGSYLSPTFMTYLQNDLSKEAVAGELSLRTQSVSLAPGFIYSDADVTDLGNDEWQVYMQLEVKQYQDNVKIKDYIGDYYFLVAKNTGDPLRNMYQLSIMGFAKDPVRVSVIE